MSSFAYESPARITRQLGGTDLLMCCSDYPHSEGTDDALGDYGRLAPRTPDPAAAPGLFGENAAWLFGVEGQS